MIILLVHVSGTFTSIFWSTPNLTSRSKPPLTASCQCRGTTAGDFIATGVASGFTKSLSGGLFSINGKGCLSQTLKAEAAYRLMIYCLRMGRLSTVGLQGSVGMSDGGSVRGGHEQTLSPGMMMPVLVHDGKHELWLAAAGFTSLASFAGVILLEQAELGWN